MSAACLLAVLCTASASHATSASARAAIRMNFGARERIYTPSPQAAAEMGQLIATSSAADQRRAHEAAALTAVQAAGTDPKAAAQDAFMASLAQPRAPADGVRELLQTIKDAGVAGVISFGLVQAAFWAASLPVYLVAYGLASGHWYVPVGSICTSGCRGHIAPIQLHISPTLSPMAAGPT